MEKYTTVALKDNQYLVISIFYMSESAMIGYTNGVRDKSLDGFYSNRQLKTKKP